ncbi:MAG: hypothetical protein U0228_21600 [Myxococcaceae bacterium]
MWSLVRIQEQRALVFTYTDPQAGPSAKGSLIVGELPTPDEARSAVTRPNLTVRIGPGIVPFRLKKEEVAALALPAEPEWLAFFRPKGTGRWASDPLLAGHFHADFPDDVRAGFFLVEQRQVEQMWVRLDGAVPELGAWQGTLLNTAHADATLAAGRRVTVRGAVGTPGPVWLSPAIEENLRTWEGRCGACGFDLVLTPIEDLIKRQFPDAPPDAVLQGMTTRCAMCNQTQVLQRRPARLAPTSPPPPSPAPALAVAPAAGSNTALLLTIGAIALGLAALIGASLFGH